jgi:hypothetical protein
MAGCQRALDTHARSYNDQQWDNLLNSGDALLNEIEDLLDQVWLPVCCTVLCVVD